MQNDKTIRVLIVDDEDRFRATTAAILEKRGFRVRAVAGGPEAIEEIEKNNFDVVILDVKMPGMDGNEALREIKRIRPEIEVIMLTGHGTPDSALAGLQDGVFDYLSKPCDLEMLASKIRDAFAKKKGVSEEERRVKDIMVPLSEFSTIRQDKSVAEAIKVILQSFTGSLATGTVRESVHHSILILDDRNDVIGAVRFRGLIQGLQPDYMRLMKNRPSMADSVHIDPPGYSGMFTIMARDLAQKTVRDLMDDAPPTIDAGANLMEAVNSLISLKVRKLLVVDGGKVVGVVREQDLFFEIANVIGHLEG
ncbi:MAG: response regulator [bacterium]